MMMIKNSNDVDDYDDCSDNDGCVAAVADDDDGDDCGDDDGCGDGWG